jgi:hypothetical protein
VGGGQRRPRDVRGEDGHPSWCDHEYDNHHGSQRLQRAPAIAAQVSLVQAAGAPQRRRAQNEEPETCDRRDDGGHVIAGDGVDRAMTDPVDDPGLERKRSEDQRDRRTYTGSQTRIRQRCEQRECDRDQPAGEMIVRRCPGLRVQERIIRDRDHDHHRRQLEQPSFVSQQLTRAVRELRSVGVGGGRGARLRGRIVNHCRPTMGKRSTH